MGGFRISSESVSANSANFDEFPVHQLDFKVAGIDIVNAIAKRYGEGEEGDILVSDGIAYAAIRNPDGNTIEIYAEKEW